MTILSHYLTDDHHHCDDLFAEAENAIGTRDWSTGQARFLSFQAAALTHFEREESLLFPSLEAATGMHQGPTQVMRAEHAHMREVLAAMASALTRRDDEVYLGLSETLLMLMRQHNMKEEQILYPLSDQALADLGEDLVERMRLLK